tara:strand:- start:11611 stop:13929 length:2319 start_codon:yes stop_codon:yes gene_type:complete
MPSYSIPDRDNNTIFTLLRNDANGILGNGNEITRWINSYKNKNTTAPFPAPNSNTNTISENKRYTFIHRDRVFSGVVFKPTAAAAAAAVVTGNNIDFKENTIVQHMNDGTQRRKVDIAGDLIDVTENEAFNEIEQYVSNGVRTPRFWYNMKQNAGLVTVQRHKVLPEEALYSVLKPYYQFLELLQQYNVATGIRSKRVPPTALYTERSTELFSKMQKLFYSSSSRVGFANSGQLVRDPVRQQAVSTPSIPEFKKIGRNKYEISWSGVDTYSYYFLYGEQKGVNNITYDLVETIHGTKKVKEITDNTITKIHIGVAFNRYKKDTNDLDAPQPATPLADPADQNYTTAGWSYRVIDFNGKLLPDTTKVTMALYDIDIFRLKINGKFDTIFDVLQYMSDNGIGNVTEQTPLDPALDYMDAWRSTARDNGNEELFSWDSHLKIPMFPRGGGNTGDSWNQLRYEEKLAVILYDLMYDRQQYDAFLQYADVKKVVFDPTAYERPRQRGGVNLDACCDVNKSDLNFDVVERFVANAQTKALYDKQPTERDNILLGSWKRAKERLQIFDRKLGMRYPDFVYLNKNGKGRLEKLECDRLINVKRSLDYSNKVGYPVMIQNPIAPYNYHSNVHSARVTTFGVRNYDRTQSYPLLKPLPRVLKVIDDGRNDNFVEKYDKSNIMGLNINYQQIDDGNPRTQAVPNPSSLKVKIREAPNGIIPHPEYPSRIKSTLWDSIVGGFIPTRVNGVMRIYPISNIKSALSKEPLMKKRRVTNSKAVVLNF